MSDRSEIRVSDQDAEMLAIKAIGQAFAGLDRESRKRVLNWTQDKYIDSELRGISSDAWEGIKAQMEALNKYAADLGVTQRELVHALSAMREGKVAPVEVRDGVEDEVRAVEEQLRRE